MSWRGLGEAGMHVAAATAIPLTFIIANELAFGFTGWTLL